MKMRVNALRLTILVGESDTWRHRNLAHEIVQRAKKAGLSGASVFHGFEGFGANRIIHTTRFLSLTDNLPIAIVIVDTREKVQSFLPELDDIVEEGSVVVEECELIRYSQSTHHPAGIAE
jgi:PII-like signaling protein